MSAGLGQCPSYWGLGDRDAMGGGKEGEMTSTRKEGRGEKKILPLSHLGVVPRPAEGDPR